jgi:hypothetical protein
MPGLQHCFAVLIAAIAPDYTTAQDAPHIIGRSLLQGNRAGIPMPGSGRMMSPVRVLRQPACESRTRGMGADGRFSGDPIPALKKTGQEKE